MGAASTKDDRARKPKESLFRKQVRVALEHFEDTKWLGNSSPLATPYFLGAYLARFAGAETVEGRGRALQGLLRLAADGLAQLGKDGAYWQQLLELRFFTPKTLDFVLDALFVAKTTYYRHETTAIQMLEDNIIQLIRPSLRTELPRAVNVLVGRDALVEDGLAALKRKHTLCFSGSSGMGKTALGSKIAQVWANEYTRQAVFWFSLKPGINDRLYSLLFAIGHFLHHLGASSLWLQLIASQGSLDPSVAHSLLLYDLSQLNGLKTLTPLLCIDDIDLLRPNESEPHAHISAFLNSLRHTVPILIIGQPGDGCDMIEADTTYVISGLSPHEVALWLEQVNLSANENEAESITAFTSGTPRLIELSLELLRSSRSVSDMLAQFSASPSVSSLLNRIFVRLGNSEQILLKILAVFTSAAPADAWVHTTLSALTERGLAKEDLNGGALLDPAIRDAVIQLVSPEECENFNLIAAQLFSMRADFTSAAHHYTCCERHSLALWTWYTHRQHEIDSGKARKALTIFERVPLSPLSPNEREVLTIIRSELRMTLGELAEAREELSKAPWDRNSLFAVLARQMRSVIDIRQSAFDQAIQEIKSGLDDIGNILEGQAIQFHLNFSRASYSKRDLATVWREARIAECDLYNWQGYLHYAASEFSESQMLYAKTLEIAEKIGYAHGCARAQEGLADLCEMAGDFDATLELRKRAEKYYADIGDLYRLSYVLESQANTLLNAKRFDQALPYAMRALSNCARLDSKEGMASIQKLLAEIHLELRDFNEAERYWKLFTRSGVALLKPFGPYILGKIRLEQGDLEQAEILIKQSLIAFEGEGQRIRIAYVKRALGRVYARRGDITQAHQLLQEALKEFHALAVHVEIKDTQHLLDEVTR